MNQAVILAGGLGTRLRPFTENNPKPMVPIQGIPFIEYLIKQVKRFGINDILILLGYMPEKIMDFLGDGEKFGVNITYDITPVEYETGNRLKKAKEKLSEEFLLLYCDNYCPINFEEAYKQYKDGNHLVQITAYSNQDGYTKGNLCINDDTVIKYDKRREQPNLMQVDIGYAFVNKQVLNLIPEENVNFEGAVYPKLVEEKQLGVFVTQHRYYSIGSWERIEATREFFRPKKVIFLDRDGTLNVRPAVGHYIESPEEFVWLEGAREALLQLKENGYQIYLISNQAGVRRGIITKETVEKTNQKMQNQLRELGIELDQIYYCPHSWEEECECRKPKPGMLYQAQREHSFDLTDSILIGDDIRDIQTGQAANCKKNILVSDEYSLYDAVQDLLRD